MAQRRVSISLTDPKKDGKLWAVRAIATVTEGKNPIEGHEVEVFLEGVSVGKLSTDSDGRALLDFSVNNQPGKHLIEVRCADIRTEQRRITIPEPRKRKEGVKVLVTPHQAGLEHTLYCRLLTVEGDSQKPRRGTLVFFNRQSELGRARTSVNGEATFIVKLESHEKRTAIRIVVQGTSVTQVVHLYQKTEVSSWDEAHGSTF